MLRTSAVHQLFLILLTVAVFLIEVVPLELQRRIVNDVVKHRPYRQVIILCAAYAGCALVHGATKLALNTYRAWVGERATRDLRRLILGLIEIDLIRHPSAPRDPEAHGIEIAMVVAEVEPIGGFVAASLSEPILQGGVLASVLAYMVHLDLWMAATTLALFMPQFIFVPLLQNAINRHTATRVWVLRHLGGGLIGPVPSEGGGHEEESRIDRVFALNMSIFRFKFTMNFLMNLGNHLQIIAALLVGGWAVLTDQLEVGGVVAFITCIGRLNDPWGDLVNYFRDFSNTQLKFRLVADAVNQLAQGRPPGGGAVP